MHKTTGASVPFYGKENKNMTYAAAWFILHMFGVFIAFSLLVIVSQKEDTNYEYCCREIRTV